MKTANENSYYSHCSEVNMLFKYQLCVYYLCNIVVHILGAKIERTTKSICSVKGSWTSAGPSMVSVEIIIISKLTPQQPLDGECRD